MIRSTDWSFGFCLQFASFGRLICSSYGFPYSIDWSFGSCLCLWFASICWSYGYPYSIDWRFGSCLCLRFASIGWSFGFCLYLQLAWFSRLIYSGYGIRL